MTSASRPRKTLNNIAGVIALLSLFLSGASQIAVVLFDIEKAGYGIMFLKISALSYLMFLLLEFYDYRLFPILLVLDKYLHNNRFNSFLYIYDTLHYAGSLEYTAESLRDLESRIGENRKQIDQLQSNKREFNEVDYNSRLDKLVADSHPLEAEIHFTKLVHWFRLEQTCSVVSGRLAIAFARRRIACLLKLLDALHPRMGYAQTVFQDPLCSVFTCAYVELSRRWWSHANRKELREGFYDLLDESERLDWERQIKNVCRDIDESFDFEESSRRQEYQEVISWIVEYAMCNGCGMNIFATKALELMKSHMCRPRE